MTRMKQKVCLEKELGQMLQVKYILVPFIFYKGYLGPDEDILNQFSATSFKYLNVNNPLRRNCIRITLSP